GRAGALTAPGLTAVVAGRAPTSSTVPHAWHSPHRPTHLTVVQPHSAHRYAGLAAFPTIGRLAARADVRRAGTARPYGGWRWAGPVPAGPWPTRGRAGSSSAPARAKRRQGGALSATPAGHGSEEAPAEHVGVGDLQAVDLGERRLGHLGGELDAEHGGEVLPAGEHHAQVELAALPAVPRPEPLDRLGRVRRQGGAEPAAEGAAGGVDVDDEGGAAPAHHPGELPQARLAPGAEEVRPAGDGDVHGGV